MRPPSLLRVILLLLSLLALGWILHLRQERPSSQEALSLGLPRDFGPIARFVFQSGSDSLVVVSRGDEYWLAHPLEDRADPILLALARHAAEGLRAARVLPDTLASPFGLDPPRRRFSVMATSGAVWGMALGDSSPVGPELYARPLGARAPIVLLDWNSAKPLVAPPLDALRDRVAAPLREGGVDSIVVQAAGRRLRARHEGPGRWVSLAPAGLQLEASKIDRIVQAMRGPSISGFLPPNTPLEPLGLRPPRAVWVLFQRERVDTVIVGHASPDGQNVYILPWERAHPATLASDFYRDLVDGWPGLADRHLLSAPAESISAVEFLGDPGAGAYRKSEGRWIRSPSGHPVPRGEALQQDLQNLAVLQWTRSPDRSLDPPPARARLSLRLLTPSSAETLELAAGSDSLALARSTRRPLWGQIPALAWRAWRYRSQHPE